MCPWHVPPESLEVYKMPSNDFSGCYLSFRSELAPPSLFWVV